MSWTAVRCQKLLGVLKLHLIRTLQVGKLSTLQVFSVTVDVVFRWRHLHSRCHSKQRISKAGNLKKRMRCKLEVDSNSKLVFTFLLINTDTIKKNKTFSCACSSYTVFSPELNQTHYLNSVTRGITFVICAFKVLGMYQNDVVSWLEGKNKTKQQMCSSKKNIFFKK